VINKNRLLKVVLLTGIIILTSIIMFSIINYNVQKRIASKIFLSWYNPENMTNINETPTHIIIKGKGEPLFLVHGSQMNIYDWRSNIEYFSKYYTVYAFDMIGCGFTAKPDAIYSPEYFADFINSIMEKYKIHKASFIGSSWGGGHVLHFTLKYPQKVRKLVLSSPCGFPHKMMLLDELLAIPIIGNLIMMCGNRNVVKGSLENIVYEKKYVTEELINSVFKPLYDKGAINATVKSYQNDDFTFVANHVDSLEVPVLIIWGDKDTVHPKWMMDEMNRRIKNSELYILKDVGHLPHEESSYIFNQKTMDFLNDPYF